MKKHRSRSMFVMFGIGDQYHRDPVEVQQSPFPILLGPPFVNLPRFTVVVVIFGFAQSFLYLPIILYMLCELVQIVAAFIMCIAEQNGMVVFHQSHRIFIDLLNMLNRIRMGICEAFCVSIFTQARAPEPDLYCYGRSSHKVHAFKSIVSPTSSCSPPEPAILNKCFTYTVCAPSSFLMSTPY